jgi:hypothetical protein
MSERAVQQGIPGNGRSVRWCVPVVALSLVMGWGQAARAQAELTKKEVADGWIMLFDGETTFGWKIDDDAEVEDGELILGGDDETTAVTTAQFRYFDLRIDYKVKGDEPKLVVGEFEVSIPKDADVLEFEVPEDFEDVKTASPIRIEVPEDSQLSIEAAVLKPRGLASIFNGRNLDGWKVLPDHKSVYSVTPDGYLNVKNGNGQIETEGTWDDFVLQLDIISNGDHLNSGVFIRGEPGGFWTGYESQIRNQWVTDVELKDGTKHRGSYTEKDDKVELQICKVDGKKVQLTNERMTFEKDQIADVVHHRDLPVDFGTGGLYFYFPARRVIPNDREWSTKTIVANGNHLAVWINGYQTAEFTDTRERGTNARTNQRLEAGTISLQGHDPTTDLSFRKIRIAPLHE